MHVDRHTRMQVKWLARLMAKQLCESAGSRTVVSPPEEEDGHLTVSICMEAFKRKVVVWEQALLLWTL
jgi:hypothetical protein